MIDYIGKSPTAFRTYFEKRLGMTLREWRNRNAAL